MQTSLWAIANKAAQDKSYRFRNLFSLLTASALLWCWEFINKKAAAGVDRESAQQYEQNLTANVMNLAVSVKGGWYRAK